MKPATILTLRIDPAKSVFAVCGRSGQGKAVLVCWAVARVKLQAAMANQNARILWAG